MASTVLARRRLAGAGALVALIVGGAGCGGGGDPGADGSRHLTVGYGYGFDAGDTGDFIAFQRLQRNRRIAVSAKELGSPANAVVALQRGDIDIAYLRVLDIAKVVHQGANVRAILPANTVAEQLLVASKEVRRPSDLRGKRIGYSRPGSDSEALARFVLRRGGVREADAHFSTVPDSAARAAALASGRIDAGALEYVDFQRLLRQKPGFHVLGRLPDYAPSVISTAYLVTRDFASKNRELLQDFVGGMLDGYAFVYQAQGRQAWIQAARRGPLEHDTHSLVAATYDFYRALRFWPRRDRPVTRGEYDRSVRYWIDTKQLDAGDAFDRVWDISFLKAAATG